MLRTLQSQQVQLVNNFQRDLFEAFETYGQMYRSNHSPPPSNTDTNTNTTTPDINSMKANMSSQNNLDDTNILEMMTKMMNKMNDLELKVNRKKIGTTKILPTQIKPRQQQRTQNQDTLGEGTARRADVAIIGVVTTTTQKQDIQLKQLSKTG